MTETQVVTFGCRLNIYESEVIKGLSQEAGLENAIIFNTCAVTSEAERQARQAIRRAKRDHPDKKIIVTGCAVQINPEKYAKMPEVDRVIGNHEKMIKSSFDPNQSTRILVNDIMTVKETVPHLVQSFDGKTRAFIEVQNGCDHRCTFCTIPLGRGNSRSVPIGVIVNQVKELVNQGFSEVVLTGVDVTSYGGDLPGAPPLGQMIRRLLNNVPDLKRLRLSSLDPMEVDPDLLDLICHDSRLMPHIHLSVQAGHDLILKRMKRRHLRADVIRLCEEIHAKRPEVVFGADIIAGFPTETEEMFQQTLDLVGQCTLVYLHVFPYSPRPGTPAARMPQVDKASIKDRAQRLRSLGDRQLEEFLTRQLGKTHAVLIEKDAHRGHGENFAPFYFEEPQTPGTIVQAKAMSMEQGMLKGKVDYD
ncbi:MAG: tRNA (N(6)-L-threonylcarbamoyladenosine(37)-C(2))-methylthiotransferase MtaB [Alphaproteobacteria bacterium]|nr:tRNA (N(6)-L-threonylcarbamoyladenosine(37)-C(2))-methylthiotransferase MtaB [Alphaproteobacteria bacterium]